MKNRVNKYHYNKIVTIGFILLFMIPLCVFAQNRGNALGFQGLTDLQLPSARITALGGATTAMSGDANMLYQNPAGLTGLEKIQFSLSGGGLQSAWMENQMYRVNRLFVTLPFYLEKLYIPDPANNGMWDYEVYAASLLDTSYLIGMPDTGLTHYSEEAADWIKTINKLGISDITVAVPMTLFKKEFTVAAGLRPQVPILDYDRNETYLDPHIAYSEYDVIPLLDGSDTVRMNWYDYIRQREGTALSVYLGAGMQILPWLSAGLNIEYMAGTTNDLQSKDKIGYFDLNYQNKFMYSYDTLNTSFSGISNYSAFKSNIGLLMNTERLSVGIDLSLPYMINRSYEYIKTVSDAVDTVVSNAIGAESVNIPAGFKIGFAFKPVNYLKVMLDIGKTPYQNSVWTLVDELEEFQRTWVTENVLAFGVELTPVKNLDLRAGYRSVTQVFVPDGAAIRTVGPEKISWSFGAGYDLGKLGKIDFAYVISNLQYYDQYYSNINYASELSGRWIVGYSIGL